MRPAVSLGDIRPTNFDGFIGRDSEKTSLINSLRALERDVESAKKMDIEAGKRTWEAAYDVASDHVLISGLAGCGKTTLAQIYAEERSKAAINLDWPIWVEKNGDPGVDKWDGGLPDRPYRWSVVEGRMISSEEILDRYLCFMQAYGTLVIDEFQFVDKNATRILYSLMHDGEWFSRFRGHIVKVSGFSVVATTTDDDEIPEPLVSRFPIKINLNSYRKEDLCKIAVNACEKIGVSILGDEALNLAIQRGRDTPREIVSLLRMARTILRAKGDCSVIDEGTVREASIQLGNGPMGLTKNEIKVMSYLRDAEEAARKEGKTIAKGTLSAIGGYGKIDKYLRSQSFLIARGYVSPGHGGTSLTKMGREIISLIRKEPDFVSVDPSLH